ncbi:MAG TPA: Calx-beta domain-containing protein [Pyrinomonadaceae bacterium]|nr:Calx-beta domain-containing protein [Pyrinomonadaceae bacterium]
MVPLKVFRIPRILTFAFLFLWLNIGANSPVYAVNLCHGPLNNLFTYASAGGRAASHSIFSYKRSNILTGNLNAIGSLQFDSASYSVGEGAAAAVIIVTRVGGSSGQVTVDFATSNGTAIAGQDYVSTQGTLLWEDGDSTPKGFGIALISDGIAEPNETVNITLSNPTGGAIIGIPSTAVLTIVDDDGTIHTLSIANVSQPEGNAPNQLTCTVTLTPASEGVVTVNFSTSDGTATAPSDYTAIANGLLTFQPGEVSRPIVIDIIGDTVVEPDETFFVNLSNASGAVIGNTPATITLLNDDVAGTPGSVQFSSSAYNVAENVGNATITVTRTGGSTGPASVNYATSNGTATSGSDYTAVSGTLNWADGDASAKTFMIPIIDDQLQEGDETVNIALSNATGATLGAPVNAVLTIADNDTLPEVSINDVTQAEGNELNTMNFTVSLNHPFSQTVTVTYVTDNGTAIAGSDYVAVTNGSVTFQPGEVARPISIQILGDFVVEPDETFFVNLTGATNAVIADSQGVGTILNDDFPGTIQFSSNNYTVNENAGSAEITITRTGGVSEGVSVFFATVDGTANSGEDYGTVRRTVVFAPGQTTQTVHIPIFNDNIDEPDETVILGLENPIGGAVLGAPINAILTIVDNDPPPVVSINNVALNEGNSGTTPFTFTIAMTGLSSQPIQVDYSTANGTATALSDYVPINQGFVTFEPGETTKQITVLVNGDFTNEPNETFFVNLSTSSPATIAVGQGVGTILNDDFGGAFRFTSGSYSVGEGIGTLLVTVQRTGGLSDGASVNFSTVDGSATAGQDYTPVAGTLVFAGGQTTRSFNVPIINDGISEPDENFMLVLSNAMGGGSTLGSPNTATVFISDSLPLPVGNTLFDYDGDGRSDLSVFRSANNTWYLLRGTAGYTAQQFGVAGDKLAPADYDGDGKTDICVFRPSNGTWYIYMSATQTFQTFGWGTSGDIPVPSDRDGDGRTDLVVYRPSNNRWYTRLMANGNLSNVAYGVSGDVPVIGDFDADGRSDLAVFRPSNSTWYIQRTTEGFFIQTWGAAGDIPLTADFDGDGRTDLAVFRPSTGVWYLSRSSAGFTTRNWGVSTDIPVAADFDGDGRADVAVYRPSISTWYIIGSSSGILIQAFGQVGDMPTQAAFLP